MPLPNEVEGRVASLSDLLDPIEVTGDITIDQIVSNNRPVHIGQATNISQNTLTTVTTMPANGVKYITKILCSGEENAKWDIFIDTVRKATLRTIDRNVAFDFNLPLKILATEVVDIKVTHHGPDTTGTFEATIFGYTAT